MGNYITLSEYVTTGEYLSTDTKANMALVLAGLGAAYLVWVHYWA